MPPPGSPYVVPWIFSPPLLLSFLLFSSGGVGGKLMSVIYMQRQRKRGKTTHQNFETGEDDASARQDG